MKKTILVVDDFAPVTSIIATSLIQTEYNVITATNPQKALEYFDGRDIAMVVTDYSMPEMNGADLSRKVKTKTRYKNVPIIILSDVEPDTSKIDAKKAGVYGWLNKPFRFERFIKIANKILAEA